MIINFLKNTEAIMLSQSTMQDFTQKEHMPSLENIPWVQSCRNQNVKLFF